MIFFKRIINIGYCIYFGGLILDIIIDKLNFKMEELLNLSLICILLGCAIVFCVGIISFPIYIKDLIWGNKDKVRMSRKLVLYGLFSIVLFSFWNIWNMV